MSRLLRAVIPALCLGAGIGCAPKSQLRDDPFLPGRAAPTTRAWPFGSRRLPSRDRDTVRESAAPLANDPFLRIPARDVASLAPPPTAPPAVDGPPKREDDGQSSLALDGARNVDRVPSKVVSNDNVAQGAAGEKTDSDTEEEYRRVRDRLDRIGATNVRLAREESTGRFIFRCEIPHPDDPELARVFENSDDPTDDGLKAMLAVTKAAEGWLAQRQVRQER